MTSNEPEAVDIPSLILKGAFQSALSPFTPTSINEESLITLFKVPVTLWEVCTPAAYPLIIELVKLISPLLQLHCYTKSWFYFLKFKNF